LERGEDRLCLAELEESHIAIRNVVLFQKIAHAEVGIAAEARDPQTFAFQVRHGANVGLGDHRQRESIKSHCDDFNFRAAQPGAQRRGAAHLRDFDIAADQGLDHLGAGADVDQVDIETVALKRACLLGEPKHGLGSRQRAVGRHQFLRALRRCAGVVA
jgi:hypothetical protein